MSLQSQTERITRYTQKFINYPDQRLHVEMFVSCKDLKISSSTQEASSMIALYVERDGIYELNSQTEKQTRNLNNPSFAKSFMVEYFASISQNLKFVILDTSDFNKSKVIGEVFTTLDDVFRSKDHTTSFDIPKLNMKGKEPSSKLIVMAEEVKYTANIIRMAIRTLTLEFPKSIFRRPPHNMSFRLLRLIGADYSLVYESEIRKSLTPRWSDIEILSRKLCNGDHNKQIKLQIVQHCSNSTMTVFGETLFDIYDLIYTSALDFELDLFSPGTKEPNGRIAISSFDFVVRPHFVDYLQSGLQFDLILAIDYTSSNKDPMTAESLHSLVSQENNEYEKAIEGIFEILLNYNHDKRVRMVGFGGIPEFPDLKATLTQHNFPLTGDFDDPFALGVEGIIDVYRKSLKNVRLASPSYFQMIIRQAKKVARYSKLSRKNRYTILTILTDGKCHDMQDTINELLQAADLPLSIIIVGLGQSDFKKMEILDGDKGLLNSKGEKAERDIVQFIEFKKFQNNPDLLAKHVLEELPTQVVDYMMDQGIDPLMQCTVRKSVRKVVLKKDKSEGILEEEEEDQMESLTMESDDEEQNKIKNNTISSFTNNHLCASKSFNKVFDLMKKENDDEELNKIKNNTIKSFTNNHLNVYGSFGKLFDLMKKDDVSNLTSKSIQKMTQSDTDTYVSTPAKRLSDLKSDATSKFDFSMSKCEYTMSLK